MTVPTIDAIGAFECPCGLRLKIRMTNPFQEYEVYFCESGHYWSRHFRGDDSEATWTPALELTP